MRTSLIFSALVAVLAVCGCTGRIDAPAGYVALKEPAPYDFKAVSADGNVFALSSRPNEQASADLAFWSAAVEHQKVRMDGLKLAGRDEIRTKQGVAGVLFNFESGEGQGRITYLVGLFVTPQRIYTVEVGGPTDGITKELDKLRTAIATLRP